MQQSTIALMVAAIRAALDRSYPHTQPRQMRHVDNGRPACGIGDLHAAVAHAKWTVRSAQQDVTEENFPSATLLLEWLQEFIAANDIHITVEA